MECRSHIRLTSSYPPVTKRLQATLVAVIAVENKQAQNSDHLVFIILLDCGHGYAASQTSLFQLTGLESRHVK